MKVDQLPPSLLASQAPEKGWIGLMSQWLAWRVLHLSEFLAQEGTPRWLWQRWGKAPRGLKAIAGVGYKQSSAPARTLCERWKLPYIALEDGFLRSSSLGVEGDTPMSMVVDPIGIHYLAERPSLLENILQQPELITAKDLETARELIELMRRSGIGKYNNAPDLDNSDPLGKRNLILVVDQTYGDFSISGGGLCETDFIRMLDTALKENPQADVRVRIHPDCVAGYKRSCLLEAARQRGVTLESRNVSWSSLVRRAERVYVGTSQAGLEALIQGIPVTCFGAPFYAGWGLTDDRLSIPRRQARPTLEQLVAAAYIRYCRYVSPLTGRLTDVMTVARQLALQKQQDMTFAGPVTVLGTMRNQRPAIRRLLKSRWGNLRFAKDSPALISRITAEKGKLVVWADREPPTLQGRADAQQLPVWRIANGFLHSWESNVKAIQSLVIDHRGVYSDSSRPNDLEDYLRRGGFPQGLLLEAARLRKHIVAEPTNSSGPAIANQLADPMGRRRILVLGHSREELTRLPEGGKIRTDRQLLEEVRKRSPDAWIIYRPYSQAGKRQGRKALKLISPYADLVSSKAPLRSLFYQADEVHTLTSLAGFKALLYGIPVITYGAPFYAGWGLTTDHLDIPDRPRQITLDELVAAVLLLYTRYADRRLNLPCLAQHALEQTGASLKLSEYLSPHVQQLRNYLITMFGSRLTNQPVSPEG